MSDALKALYEALYTRMFKANPLWDDRVRPEYIPSTDTRPVIVYSNVTGGEKNRIRKRDPTFLIDVKIITSSDNENANRDAMDGAGFITDLIDNQGSQDVDVNGDPTDRAITGDDEWVITTITQGMRIHVVDNWSRNGVAVYHSGHEFKVTMEAI
jgi:hypothetical protein